MSMIQSLRNRFHYYSTIAMAEDVPSAALQQELHKKGWQFQPEKNEQEIKDAVHAFAFASAMGYVLENRLKIITPEGVDIKSAHATKEQRQQYKTEVREAAARLYGITAQP